MWSDTEGLLFVIWIGSVVSMFFNCCSRGRCPVEAAFEAHARDGSRLIYQAMRSWSIGLWDAQPRDCLPPLSADRCEQSPCPGVGSKINTNTRARVRPGSRFRNRHEGQGAPLGSVQKWTQGPGDASESSKNQYSRFVLRFPSLTKHDTFAGTPTRR